MEICVGCFVWVGVRGGRVGRVVEHRGDRWLVKFSAREMAWHSTFVLHAVDS